MNVMHRAFDLLRPGLFWMLLWAVIGATLSIVIGIIDPPSIDAGEGPIDLAKLLGGVGAASGVVFGLLLTLGERRRAVADIPLLRAALWGAAAGTALPLLTGINNTVIYNTLPLGVLSGTLFVFLARRTSRRRAPAPRATGS